MTLGPDVTIKNIPTCCAECRYEGDTVIGLLCRLDNHRVSSSNHHIAKPHWCPISVLLRMTVIDEEN